MVWHVVAYTSSKGFAVVRLFFPKGWKPRTEYDTPPSADCGLMNTAARMTAVDAINNRFGRRHIYYAAEDLSKAWQPRRKIRSPRYVSRWDELPVAKIVQ